jgi:REP element-mobilizing transposase RayT
MATRTPPPGFRGLDPNKPVRIYQRNLPHWRQTGATYFVTFRLIDSLPQSKLDELVAWRREWLRTHPRPERPSPTPDGRADDWEEELAREVMRRVESWLDQGHGSCRLGDPSLRRFIVDTMHHFDGQRYELGCYVVMPNHVHVVVRPFDDEDNALEYILQSWKRYAAREINASVQRSGSLWQEESFDRIIRDGEHLARVIHYVGSNPRKAGLDVLRYARWIRPEWETIGWGFGPVLGPIDGRS